MIGGRPSYRGYHIEARWVKDHWIYIVSDFRTQEEVDRFASIDDAQAQIDIWVEGTTS